MELLQPALALGATALLLSSPRLRTMRTYIFLIVLAALLLAARFVIPVPWAVLAEATALGTYAIVVLRFQYLLAGLPKGSMEFDRDLLNSTKDARTALREWRGTAQANIEADERGRRQTIESSEIALASLATMRPPNDGWALVLDLNREYFALLLVYARRGRVFVSDDSTQELAELRRLSKAITGAWSAARGRGART